MSSPIAYASSGKRISLLNPLDDDNPTPIPVPTPARKRHICVKCLKTFSTCGHLTRHGRTHTGVKDHVCPFPNCEKECGRIDNLIQHFRVHLPKGDRGRGNAYTRQCMEQLRAELSEQENGGYPEVAFSSALGDWHIPYVFLRTPTDRPRPLRPVASSDDSDVRGIVKGMHTSATQDNSRCSSVVELFSPSTVSSPGFSLSPISVNTSPLASLEGFDPERVRSMDDRPRQHVPPEPASASGKSASPTGDVPRIKLPHTPGRPGHVFEESFVRGG